MNQDSLTLASRKLLRAVTNEELDDAIPEAFLEVLPQGASCRFLRTDQTIPEDDSGDGFLCVPVRSDRHMVGCVRIDWPCTPTALDIRRERLIGQVAELAASAIVSRQESDDLRERARAEAAEVRFDMIGMLAHEMRTPLASIKGYSSALLLDELGLDDSTRIEFLQAIDEESDRLSQMVAHLLDSTVIEAGELELQREPIALAPVIRRIVDTMSKRTNRHRLVVSFDDSMAPAYADEERVHQVLINLLDNAIKYSPDGGLIMVRCRQLGAEALVQVSDQGVGIAPQHLNKLFERFFRTEQRRALGVSGTGLGLPIADSIIRAHGGRTWAESTVDRGTTLSFTLPIAEHPGDSDDE